MRYVNSNFSLNSAGHLVPAGGDAQPSWGRFERVEEALAYLRRLEGAYGAL